MNQSANRTRQSFLNAYAHKLKTLAEQPERQALASLPQALDTRIGSFFINELAPMIESVIDDLLGRLPQLPDAEIASRIEKVASDMHQIREAGEKFVVSVFSESIPSLIQENKTKELLLSVIPKIGGYL